MMGEVGTEALTLGWCQVFETADLAKATLAAATAVERVRHVILRRIVIERDIRPRGNGVEGDDIAALDDSVGIAMMIHEAPKVAIQNLLGGMPGMQIDVKAFADLDGIPGGVSGQFPFDAEHAFTADDGTERDESVFSRGANDSHQVLRAFVNRQNHARTDFSGRKNAAIFHLSITGLQRLIGDIGGVQKLRSEIYLCRAAMRCVMPTYPKW